MFVSPNLWTALPFLLVVVFASAAHSVLLWIYSKQPKDRILALLLPMVWLTVGALPPGLGWITPEDAVPVLPLMLIGLAAVGVGLAVSGVGRRLIVGTPLALLLAYQGFRLPLELIMHKWVEEGVMPPQMTWTGSNPDIVSGVLGLVGALMASRWPKVAHVFNLVAFALLFNVIRVAFTSVPNLPITSFEEPLLVAFYLPTSWIASVCVVGAFVGHVLTIRHGFLHDWRSGAERS